MVSLASEYLYSLTLFLNRRLGGGKPGKGVWILHYESPPGETKEQAKENWDRFKRENPDIKIDESKNIIGLTHEEYKSGWDKWKEDHKGFMEEINSLPVANEAFFRK